MAKAQRGRNLSKRLETTQAQFVLTELDMAITFCGLALATGHADVRDRNIANALKGYRVAVRFSKMPGQDLERAQGFQDKVKNLRALLLQLGEVEVL